MSRRCLIIERHHWETGGGQQQLQFVLNTARRFFGNRDRTLRIQIEILPLNNRIREITISREYYNGTRRTNGFSEIGTRLRNKTAFIFFEETNTLHRYKVWWQFDKAIVVARYLNAAWEQGGNSQYGRGRLSVIVDAPVSRRITRMN
jgi:hypothetical protein